MKNQFYGKVQGAIVVPLLWFLLSELAVEMTATAQRSLYLTKEEAAFITATAGSGARFIGTTAGRAMIGTIEAARYEQVAETNKRVIGAVQTIDTTLGQLSLKLDSGESVTIKLTPQTVFQRVPPGETSLQNAVKVSLAVIEIGDRVFASGQLAEDRQSVIARQIIVMAQRDVMAQQERERAQWRTRSIGGTITAINPTTKEITALMRSATGEKPMVISVNDSVRLRRYAPDSVRFSDAQPSSLAALRVGDQLRALGEASGDGARFTAEEIVFGTFRTLGGTITSVNAETKEIKLQDLPSQQPFTIVLNQDSLLRRLPPELVAQLAQRLRSPKSVTNEADWQATIERLPALALKDVQPGEHVIVSTTSGAQPNRVTAIGFFIGVEALLKEWQKQQATPGSNANLGLGLPGAALEGLRP